MTRIFPSLASLSVMLYLAAIILGLTVGELYDSPDRATLQWKGVHLLTGTAAALAVVFVHSIAVTYFVGTSRWCKEVTETYRLDPGPLRQSTLLKRRTFPWSVMGMLAVVGVGALGAASDPGTGRPDTASMANFHLLGAFAGLAFVLWTYWQVWQNISANQEVIQSIVAEVQRIRRDRGLDTQDDSASLAGDPNPQSSQAGATVS